MAFYEIILFLLIVKLTVSGAQNPILVPKSDHGRSVHDFDFVYLPKETVLQLLPGFSKHELRAKSKQAAELLNISTPTDPRAQVLAIQKARQLKMNQIDPHGKQRDAIASRLEFWKQQLDVVVEQRNRLLADLKNLRAEQHRCTVTNPADHQGRLRCLAVDDEVENYSSAVEPLNQQERGILREIFQLRKRLKSVM